MKTVSTWKEKMQFEVKAESHSITMDTHAPMGSDSALNPKQLLLAAISGCTAMDVVALLKKHKQPIDAFQVEAEGTLTEKYPIVFNEIKLNFKLTGQIEPEKFIEAVTLSQTKYCGVSAMVSKGVPISYVIELNRKAIGSGKADFN